MADQEKDKQMETRTDDMLDSLLANYSSAEPRPGLETRILANLKLENPRDAEGREAGRGWWGLKWIWVGAALAALIVGGVLINGKRHVAPPPSTVVKTVQPAVQQRIIQQPSVKQPTVQEPLVESSLPKIGAKPAIHHRHKTLVPGAQQNATLAVGQRPANFPTPFPLSEQERLMLAYLNNRPHQEVIAQMQRTDQQEADEFWEDRNGFTRKPVTR